VTRNGSVPSQKTQNAPQRTHLMDFFTKKIKGDMVAPISTPFMHKKSHLGQTENWPIL
jgi:hypothetical protein